MLGTGTANFELRERTFGKQGGPRKSSLAVQAGPLPSAAPRPRVEAKGERSYQCPIPGCAKLFRGLRAGWDAHVGSVRLHPKWHPDIKDPEARRRQFKTEFHAFFRPDSLL